VHRDIKPSNVFLHTTPSGEVPKILDFGIARLVGESAVGQKLTLDGSLLGTPAYMAPERFRRGPYGPKSDVYSIGVMLYEMLSGRLPFMTASADPLALVAMQAEEEPTPLRALNPRVPPAVETVVRQALSRDEASRPAAELLARRLAMAVADPFTPLE
jgi:serine/threonine protein kinase